MVATCGARLFNYEISNHGLEGDVETAFSYIPNGQTGHYVACANPHSLVVASKDEEFSSALREADILLPDGTGIVLAARVLGQKLESRVAGYEFFLELTRLGEQRGGLRYFFLGSSERVLSRISRKLPVEFPAIEICGTFSPSFDDEFAEDEIKKMIDAINIARPDVLWIGMTAPKQEKWIYRHRSDLNVPLIGAIGAVFDYYAETKFRAPTWVCNIGLEWLPRLMVEPKRLWRRNLISTPLFLYWVLRAKLAYK